MENYFGSYIRVVDIILAFFIIWGAYKGYQKGFIVEMISTLVFIGGIVIVFYAISQVFLSADQAIGKSPKAAKFVLFVLFYLIGSLFLNKLSRVMQKKIDYSVFDSFDNFMAMLLGGIKYAIFLAIFLGLLDAAGLRLSQEITRDTKIYPMLLDFQAWLVDVGKVIAPSVGKVHEDILRMLSE